jgi:excinuclease UvrABC nuclease subunit
MTDLDKITDFLGEMPREIPLPKAGIYFLFSGDELIYIGQSQNIFTRLGMHCAIGRFGLTEITSVFYVLERNANRRSRLEAELIGTFKPKLNRQGGAFRKVAPKGRNSLRHTIEGRNLHLRLPQLD